MLLFSTVLNINDTLTKDGFIELVIEWNKNTPHQENVIPNIDWDGRRNVKFGTEGLWLEIQEYRNGNTIAVRYEKVEPDGAIWDTDYVMNFSTMKMSVQLDRSYRSDAQIIDPHFSTPYFISLLIEKGYLKDDGNLPMAKRPTYITNDNISLLAGVINGTCRYEYPVVYVSKNKDGTPPIDVNNLSSRLKGIAHVLVQDDSWSNSQIRAVCNDNNEYFGAVGIYYPNDATPHQRLLSKTIFGVDDFLPDKIVRNVLRFSNEQNIPSLLTWSGVNTAIFNDKLNSRVSELAEAKRAQDNAEQAKIRAESDCEKAKEENEMLLSIAEDENNEFRKRIDILTHENERLLAENAGLRNKLSSINCEPIIVAGYEDDLYPGEIKEMVLLILAEELKRIGGDNAKSRRADVLRDILKINEYDKKSERKIQELKNKLKGYKVLNASLRSYLEEIGFEISDDGKHYKLTYFGDSRYYTSVSKTGSDFRGGDNMTSQIIKGMF